METVSKNDVRRCLESKYIKTWEKAIGEDWLNQCCLCSWFRWLYGDHLYWHRICI